MFYNSIETKTRVPSYQELDRKQTKSKLDVRRRTPTNDKIKTSGSSKMAVVDDNLGEFGLRKEYSSNSKT